MLKRAVWSGVAIVFALSIASQTVVQGQQGKGQAAGRPPGNLPGTFTFVTKADIEKVQKSIENGVPNDAPVRTVNMGKYDLGVYTLNTPPTKPDAKKGPVMGFYHNDIAEVYIITSGVGTWRVGGELEDPKNDDPDSHGVKDVRGPGVVGVLKGYTDQKISAGDVLIVPPGVPHSPGVMTENIRIIRVVIDPKKVLPLYPPSTNQSGGKGQGQITAAAKPVGKLPGTFTFIPKADIDRVLKETETPGPSGDRPVRTIDLANMNYRVGVYVLHSPKMPEASKGPATSGWYHNNIAEIYYFIRGAGTFTIGGTLENPTEDAADSWSTKMVRGPSVSGTFKGATNLKFVAGDVLIAPTGVPHTPSEVTAVPRDIMRIAIDPDKVLPLK